MAFPRGLAAFAAILNCVLVANQPTVEGRSSFGQSDDDNVPVTRIQSVAGMLTNLPCNITPSSPSDRVNIVLWYKDGLGKPLYSFDLRQQSLDSQGKIWASETDIEVARAQLHTHSVPTAVLALHGVNQEDAGTYRCRVDFKRSPTRYRKIALDVIVPPSKAIIMDERGMDIAGNKVGPVLEGSTLILTCDIIGGKPATTVSWWQDGQLLDSSYEEIIPGKSRNTMKVESLARRHRHSEFTCSGNNNNRSQALSKSIILDLYLRPLSVEIKNEDQQQPPVIAGQNRTFTCISFGSYPPPSIKWTIDDRFQIDSHVDVTEDNRTVSTLFLSASREMHGGKLSCKVENPLVPNSEIKASQKLQIHYPPEVSVELGSKLNAVDIREGDDVYFECTIDAFPSAERISWKKDNDTLSPNEKEGILINQFSLVLQNVGHHSIGKYSCLASNDAGKGSSQQVFLDVKYSPRCGRPVQTMGVGRNEEARLICHIDSNPPPSSIKWRFNSSTHFATLPPEKFFTDGSMSVASYTPKSEIDYGTLSCWASNEVGLQKSPCVFHVIPAGPPDPVTGCQVRNKTFTSISLDCNPGYDGGLKQYFVAVLCPYNTFAEVVVETSTPESNLVTMDKLKCDNEIASQRSFQGASFNFEHLPHGSPFTVAIFAQNVKGRSLAFVMRAFTLRSAERQVELQAEQVPNEHPAATQIRALSPGWIGITVFLPLLFCLISAGIFRTIRRATRSSTSTTTHSAPTALSSANSSSLFKHEPPPPRGANNEERHWDHEMTATTASSSVATVDLSKDSSYQHCLVEQQQWRPPHHHLMQTGSATTSRISKGKYVFAARPRRSSGEAAASKVTNDLLICGSSSVLPPPSSTPYLHYTTIPRQQRPFHQQQVALKNGEVQEDVDGSKKKKETFVQSTFQPSPAQLKHQLQTGEFPGGGGLSSTTKPPREFADESSSSSEEALGDSSGHHQHQPGNASLGSKSSSDLRLTRF